MKSKLLPPPVETERKPVTRLGLIVDFVFVVGFIWYTLVALEFSPTARHFPLFVGCVATLLALVNLVVDARRYKAQERRTTTEETVEIRGSIKYILWFVGFIVLAYLVSLLPAAVVFLTAFFRTQSKMSWLKTAIVVVCTVAVLFFFSRVFNLEMPPGLFFTID